MSPRQRALIAFAIAIPLLLLLLPLRVFEIGNPDWRPLSWLHAIAVVALTLLYIWYVGGVAWLKHFAFPVAFIFVAVPWPTPVEEPLVQGLMRGVAATATEAITLFGIPAQLEGSLIRVASGLVGVNEACSGVRSLQTSLMIGLLFGEIKRLSVVRRLVLIAGAVAIALVANFVRAFSLVWLAASSKELSAVDRWHDVAGYAIVGVVFVGTLGLAALLARNQRSEVRSQKSDQAPSTPQPSTSQPSSTPQPSTPQPSSTSQPLASSMRAMSFGLVVLAWLLAVELAAAGWYRAHERNLVARTRWSVRWPENAPSFQEIKIDEGVRRILRFDEGREVVWRANGATNVSASPQKCFLFYFRWEPGSSSVLRARAHRPDICLPSAGWRQISDNGVRNYPVAENFSLPFRHFRFLQDRGGRGRDIVADAFFCVREDWIRADQPTDLTDQTVAGEVGGWAHGDRWRVVRNGMRDLGQQVMQFITTTSSATTPEDAQTRFAALLPKLVVVERATEQRSDNE